ncbi:MAG: efflux RND transporter periplasmic adaptor subunit [Dehalococcoidia bacterium]|nr:efflux RND transporter periplasmic adaptor subunit [Dehalococcoidia bacterium]
MKTTGQNNSVTKILKSLVIFIAVFTLLVSGIGCAKKTAVPAAATQQVPVHLGNLTVSTSVDGNLVMPQAYNLLFGAPGDVREVFVEEGDFVKEGTVLATLDNTTAKLGVESSNNNVQTVLSKLYENVPLLPQFRTVIYEQVSLGPPVVTGPEPAKQTTEVYLATDTNIPPASGPTTVITTTTKNEDLGLQGTQVTQTATATQTTVVQNPVVPPPGFTIVTTTVQILSKTTLQYISRQKQDPGLDTSSAYYYPNATALSAFNWAQEEVYQANLLYQIKGYDAAASELYVALSDLEACTQILEDAINNPKSGLGNMAPYVPSDEEGIFSLKIQTDSSWSVSYIVELRKVVDSIKQGQSDIEAIRGLLAQGKYDEASPMFGPLLKQVNLIGKSVVQNINVIKAHNYSTVYGQDISLYFYNAAADKLSAALKGIETGGLNAPELNDNLLIARHYMQICNSILGSNDFVLQHGLSLKNEQQYHVDLQNALVGLGNANDDFLKTVILAPFDGTVVSVGVKKNDVLSQIDYASKTAVQLVDTSQIKFQGNVDEIDILKIKTGQKAMISVDAVPNKIFTGTVSFISPFGTADTNNVVKFPITILLDPSDVALKGGLTATADIAITSVENALLVPLSAITTTSEGSFVNVIDTATGQPEKKQVTLGSQNLQFAEVVSGLNEGDKVVVEEKAIKAPIVTGFPRGGSGSPPPR